MDPQFRDLAQEIVQAVTVAVTKSLDERLQGAFDDSEARIKKHIDEFESRAELRMEMHFENLEETLKTAGEG